MALSPSSQTDAKGKRKGAPTVRLRRAVEAAGSLLPPHLLRSHLLNSAENVTKIDKLWPKETGVFRKGVLETEEKWM